MKTKARKNRHPAGVDINKAKEQAEEAGGIEDKHVRKQFTTLKAEDGTGETGAPMAPNEEQLAKINKYTRTPKSADEVVVFDTMSCNDIPDRDDDQFTKRCVEQFASLPEPFSSIGKSYMVGHDHTSLGKGRIFDVGTKRVDGNFFLTNSVYVPNTPQYQDFIENIDFGINWAVSVGVVLGSSACSIKGCDAQYFIWGLWCANGHDKGAYYDPNSDEKDEWGYPMPVASGAKNAQKCLRLFEDPQDFYELSQVYLGAQYFAELQKDPQLAVMMKGMGDVPVVGLSKEEALKLDMPKFENPRKLTEARERGETILNEDGSLKWLDGNLVYTFDPEEDEDAVCLGTATDELVAEFEAANPPEPEEDANKDTEDKDETNDDDIEEAPEPEVDDDKTATTITDSEMLLNAATAANLPVEILEQFAAEEKLNIFSVLKTVSAALRTSQGEVTKLTTKAALGDMYIKQLHEKCIDWYVKARSGESKGVNTDTIEKLLASAGDDIELIKSLTEEYESEARAKFPAPVRRSSFPDDPHILPNSDSDDDHSARESALVSRLHR